MVDPGRPDFQPGLVAPVAVGVPPALETFDVIDKFFPAIFTEFVGYAMIALCLLPAAAPGAPAGDGQAAFLALDGTARPAKKVLDGTLFAFVEQGVLFLPGAIPSIAYGNDIGHEINSALTVLLN